METGEGSGNKCSVAIRADLEVYFGVHDESTLYCKLCATPESDSEASASADVKKRKRNGTSLLAFRPRWGWFNFERHLVKRHGFPKTHFEKTGKPGAEKRIGNKKPHVRIPVDDKLRYPAMGMSTEKCCVICRNFCASSESNETGFSGRHHYFVGSEGCVKLNEQLFSMFFVRNIIDFPAWKCEAFLQKCKGLRMPETWFFFCLECKDVITQTAELHYKILSLENRLKSLKTLIKAKVCDSISINTDVAETSIEVEIRNYISGSDSSSPRVMKQKLFATSSVEDEIELTPRKRRGRPPKNKDVDITLLSEPELVATVKIEQPYSYDEDFSELEHDTNNVELYEPSETDYASDDSDFTPTKKSNTKRKQNGSSLSTNNTKKGTGTRATASKAKKRKNVESIVTGNDDGTNEDPSNSTEAQGWICSICPTKYKTLKSFQDHQEAHELSKAQNNEYDCPLCGYPCLNEKAKALHTAYKHGDRDQLQCTLCSYEAPSRKILSVHLKQHKENSERERIGNKFPCKICNRLFPSYAMLCKHKRSAHYTELGLVPVKCELCAAIFSKKKHLRDHIQQTHQRESKYYCEICGKGTMYMSKLKRHMKTHIKDTTYVCEICGADFLYTETLRNHIKKEHPRSDPNSMHRTTEEVKHKCKHCGIELPSISCLVRHVKSHTELFQHKCDLCDNGYATQQSLRRHKEINHSGELVPCPYCTKLFLHKEYVKSHYKFCKRYPGREEISGEPMEHVQNVETVSEISLQKSLDSGMIEINPESRTILPDILDNKSCMTQVIIYNDDSHEMKINPDEKFEPNDADSSGV